MKPVSMRAMSMPTLFEEAASVGASPSMISADHLLMAADGSQDMRGYYTDSPMMPPMSPRQMMLRSLDVDASIEDTGISAEEVQAYISEQDLADSKWTCLFPECGKRFGRKENIRSHVQTHLGDRQFKCNHCQKCFVRQHDLKRHAKIHSGDKPHRCPCGNGFARQDALTRHRQRGVCEGALPGCAKREMAKRGRPRKRPDMSDRVDKASRARAIDARRGSEATYTSSSSCPSVRSDPYTPPHQADYYESDAGPNTLDGVAELDALIKQYEDTPPTSPLTAGTTSPTKTETYENTTDTFDFATLSEHYSPAVRSNHSSPLVSQHEMMSQQTSPVVTSHTQSESFADSVFDWGAIEPQPSLCADAFSPGGGSSSSASEFEVNFDQAFNQTKSDNNTFMGSEGFADFGSSAMFNTALESPGIFSASMEAWLTNN